MCGVCEGGNLPSVCPSCINHRLSPLHMCVRFEMELPGELFLTLSGIKSWLFDFGAQVDREV